MSNDLKSNVKNARTTVLPEDSKAALTIMTSITRQLLELLMEETKVLKAKDLLTLNAMQKGKEMLAKGYAQACTEFQERFDEFKGLDENLIGRLETLTQEMGKVARDNQKRFESLSTKKPLKSGAQNNLYLLQSDELQKNAVAAE
jgi:hypothetical protein